MRSTRTDFVRGSTDDHDRIVFRADGEPADFQAQMRAGEQREIATGQYAGTVTRCECAAREDVQWTLDHAGAVERRTRADPRASGTDAGEAVDVAIDGRDTSGDVHISRSRGAGGIAIAHVEIAAGR